MFKDFFNDIRHYTVVFRTRRNLRRAQNLANRLGCQVFCVKINGRVAFLTKDYFKELRSKGVFPKSFTAVQLKDISLFTVKPDPAATPGRRAH